MESENIFIQGQNKSYSDTDAAAGAAAGAATEAAAGAAGCAAAAFAAASAVCLSLIHISEPTRPY